MKLKSFLLLPLAALCGLLVTGCLPHERFWWSPDGSQAVLVTDDGLHLVKPGQLPGPPLLTSTPSNFPTSASWAPDGSGFVAVQTLKVKTWAEVRALIPATEAEEVEKLALGVPGLVESMIAMAGKEEDVSDVVQRSPLVEKGTGTAAFSLAYEERKDLIDAILKKVAVGEKLVKDLQEEDRTFEVYEICHVRPAGPGGLPELQPLVRSLRPLTSPQISPHHGQVAFLRIWEKAEESALELCPLKGGAPVEITRGVGGSFVWSPDGRSLVVTTSFANKEDLMRRVQRLVVLDEAGSVIERKDLPTALELATAFMPTPPRLVGLPDGRVLFAALPVTLPVAGTGPELAPLLYVVSLDGKTLSTVPMAPGSLPVDLSWFVASPDGKRVAVVESGTDAVAVMELETGKSQVISPAHPQWRCRTLPAWKSSTELTFAALGKGGTQPEWMLWNVDGSLRSLSESWPPATTGEWLSEEKRSEETPEAAPTPASR